MWKVLSPKTAPPPLRWSCHSDRTNGCDFMEKLIERIEMALGAMALGGPRNLRAYLERPGPDFEDASKDEVDAAIDLLLSADPNHPARLRFSNLLRSWDNA